MRQHLIATGLRVLHSQGFNGCGVQEITDAAQVPKGSFYNHFESKEQFGAEVLGRYWEDRLSRAQRVLSDETRPPLERLRAYFDGKTGAGIAARSGGVELRDPALAAGGSELRGSGGGELRAPASAAGGGELRGPTLAAGGSELRGPTLAAGGGEPRSAMPAGGGRAFGRGCMIGNFAAELAGQSRLVRDRLDLVYAAWTRLLATCIREAQQDGSLRTDDDPESLAAFLIDAFEGAVLRSKVDQDPTALHRFHRIVFTRLLV
ncbi:MAG: TetR family transcriptional regulator C-terminal domain-containing protein [Rhodospirillales bacterium]|nr:TetR family transcriptional regulator C-terminal domain-containing protein [Rhodospirillales bacterium]